MERTHSREIGAGSRIYYIDRHTDTKSNDYLTIAEVNRHRQSKRKSILVHRDHLRDLIEALKQAAAELGVKA